MNSPCAGPFPPSTLTGVPIEYIIEQLRSLAPHYWDNPETADCTIIVPIPYVKYRPKYTAESSSIKFRHLIDLYPSATGSRITEISFNGTRQLTFKLHMDYLAAHSSYLHALFCGAHAMDLINSRSSLSPESVPQYTVPPNRLPKLLSSVHEHPVLYLPVPDPTSFHLLLHWMYFNQTNIISEALHNGSIQWEGIARNVEYLRLNADIKIFLSKWYHSWLEIDTMRGGDFDYESDTYYSDSDDGDTSTCTYNIAVTDNSVGIVDSKERPRGRSRETRRLSH